MASKDNYCLMDKCVDNFPLGVTGRWATGGAVVSPHYLASEAGAEMLRRGGTAADAIIAASAVLGVVYPHMCGIGGDGFALIEPGSGAPVTCLNASGWSSSLSNSEELRRRGLETVPLRGGLAITVPGIVEGWRQLAGRFGKLPFSQLLQPAIQRAGEGYPVTRRLARWVEEAKDVLEEDPWLAQHFLPGGSAVSEGYVIHLPDLARTLETLAAEGPRSFYRGEIASDIVDAIRANGGVMVEEDLSEFSALWVRPIVLTTGALTIAVPPPNSQGVTLLWMLRDMEVASVSHMPSVMVALARAKMRAFDLRDRVLTDPVHMTVPTEELLELREVSDVSASATPPAGGTVYLAAWDSTGTLASMIHSIYYDFGSGIVVPGRGIILQNRGAYFALDERAANVLRPRKRPLHTLMCSVIRDEQTGERLALGTMGGDGQPQVLAQLILHRRSGLDWEQALRAARWVHGRIEVGEVTESVRYEARLAPEVVDALGQVGETVAVEAWEESLGHAHVLSVRDGVAFAAIDPRSDGGVGIP